MAEAKPVASQIQIRLDGKEVPQEIVDVLLDMVVEQHTHLPDMFTLRLYDKYLALVDEGPFDLTKEVEIDGFGVEGEKTRLFKGEITALEPAFGEGMVSHLTVRGFDRSHRLYRETRSRAYVNVTDSEIAKKLAESVRLQIEADQTTTIYDHLYQHNQSDLAYLRGRAQRIGFECFVEGNKLYFRRPKTDGSRVVLTWGEDLVAFRPQMSLAEQVDEVLVRGWDADRQKPIVGQAQSGGLYPHIGEKKDGGQWGQSFGSGKLVIVDEPVVSQEEADALAAARLDELSGAFVEAAGTAFRRPDIRAGQLVTIDNVGRRFGGTYLVTSARHIFNPRGLRTHFKVKGTRSGLLSEGFPGRAGYPDRWPGIVPALVTNTNDPKGWGRVKVTFPWMDENVESNWARLAGAGAGPDAGFFCVPKVNDEVVVAFEHGDFDRPYVLGGLWNGKNQVPAPGAGAAKDEKPLVRTWRSPGGHAVTMYDRTSQQGKRNKLEIITAAGHKIIMDDAEGQLTIMAKTNLALTAKGNIDIDAKGTVSVKGKTIDLN